MTSLLERCLNLTGVRVEELSRSCALQISNTHIAPFSIATTITCISCHADCDQTVTVYSILDVQHACWTRLVFKPKTNKDSLKMSRDEYFSLPWSFLVTKHVRLNLHRYFNTKRDGVLRFKFKLVFFTSI